MKGFEEDLQLDLSPEVLQKLANIKRYMLPTGYLSHSQIEMYMRCPRQYEFRYVKGEKRPPGVPMALGSSAHEALETTHNHIVEHGTPAPLEQVQAAFSDSYDKNIADVPAEEWKKEDEVPALVKNAGMNLVTQYNMQFAPHVKPMVKDGVRGIEQKFEMVIVDVPMVGYIDLIDVNSGVAITPEERALMASIGPAAETPTNPDILDMLNSVVTDFKTKSKSLTEEDVKSSFQLTLYSYVTGIPTVRYDQLLRQKVPKLKRMNSTRTKQDHLWMEEIIRSTAQAISAGVFPPCSPTSWTCSAKWCGYWSLCRGKRV